MRFRFSSQLGSDDRAFSAAVRRLCLGGPARWSLTSERGTDSGTAPLAAGADELGRVRLGALEWAATGGAWERLRGETVADPPAAGAVLALGNELTAVTTPTAAARARPRFRAWSGPLAPGQLLLDLGLSGTDRVQTLLDQELSRLPGGRIPVYLQDGTTDLDALGWLAALITDEVDPRGTLSPPAVVLTGGDGDGWHLVPLHGLRARDEVPEVRLPAGVTELRFVGWGRPAPGPRVRARSPECCCGVLRGTGEWDPEAFRAAARTSAVLPLRLPSGVAVANRPTGDDELWVVQVADRVTHSGRHEIELLVCADPAALFAPAPPAAAPPGGTYWATAGAAAAGVPDWTAPCRFVRLDGPPNVPIVLSTPYGGKDQLGGLHFVPESGTAALVHWTGRLSEPPVFVTQPRPAGARKGKGKGRAAPDVRELGRAALLLPPDRELVVRAPAVRADAEKDVRLRSRTGRVVLDREHGRALAVGPALVEVDPAERPE